MSTDLTMAQFRYGFMPPMDGTLTVLAAVLATGSMGVWGSYDFPSIWADAQLTLRLTIWQRSLLLASDSEIAAHLHCSGDSHDMRIFVDEAFPKICAAYVVHDEPVTVAFTAFLEGRGNSDFAHAELNFTQHARPNYAQGSGIRVPELCMFLGPPIPVVVG